ncbi:SRPBCC family protein [Halopelagius fulvigenes]|uniref:SRPBCC family protein n=1 Tax=Halopelagius fulvigenes TaxID=1198324 RepID=A0ABD5U3H4_9EURY
MRELVTTIAIDAAPDRVWEVLTDFECYSEWNPFMRITGRANEGARIAVELYPPEGRGAAFRPTVTASEYGREFRWVGHLGVPGLFDGEHRFVLEPDADGERTTLTHAETFRGVLSGVLFRAVGDNTEAGFRQMNEALKARAESPAPDIASGWADGNAS